VATRPEEDDVTSQNARRDNVARGRARRSGLVRGSLLTATAAVGALLLAGCGTGTGAAPARDRPASQQPPAAASAAADSWVPDDGPAGVLAAIRTQQFADHDRVVFQFHGRQAPSVTLAYADQITKDPSDQPLPLLGTRFIRVVFHGARLDTAALENDPTKVVGYRGPTTLTPRYQTLQQLSVAGDFEAVLSFGLGLSETAELRTSMPDGQGSVIIDLWPTADTNQ
jgi:hypothetical protein